MKIICTLGKTLERLEITKNRLSVESKVRANTIHSLAKNEAKAINFETMENIANALDQIAKSKGINEKIGITDILEIK